MAKILLVDDSKTLLMHIKRMLVQGGHEVTATASGGVAVEHLRKETVDLVLTDLYMPEPDGFEIVQAVRALPQPPPLIVMSSNSLACDIFRDARDLGAAATLQKPFTASELLDTIRHVLTLTSAAAMNVPAARVPSPQGFSDAAMAASA